MANRSVALYRYVKTKSGAWKRLPVVMSANGRLKADVVLEDGVEVAYPVGHYVLRRYEGSKTVWVTIEGGSNVAMAELRAAQKKQQAIAQAKTVGVQVVEDFSRKTLRQLFDVFVQAAEDRGSDEAAELYRYTADEFLMGCTKTYLEELEHADVARFHGAMRKAGRSDRTISNRHSHLRSFLVFAGLDRDKLKAIAGPTPRYEKALPEVYSQEELDMFFQSLEEEYDQLVFDVFLQTGFRERELTHLMWPRVSEKNLTLMVRSNTIWKFKPKDSEQREVPVTRGLMDRLMAYKERHPKAKLVFGKRGGEVDEPEGHLLRRLKIKAKYAGLNCGVCAGCCAERKECEHWYLHKFRATYITTLLRNGMDVRTVMKLSGHSDLESVLRYIRPAEDHEIRAKIAEIKWR